MRVVAGIAAFTGTAVGASALTLWLVGTGHVPRCADPAEAVNAVALSAPSAEPGAADRFYGAALATRDRGTAAPSHSEIAAPSSARLVPDEAGVVVRAQVVTRMHAPAPSARPAGELPRHELVRELQREMVRLGCYSGEPNGEWGPGARRSMRAFLERANSRLSGDEPDMLQLTLLRGHVGRGCRAPVGDTIAAGGAPMPPVAPAQSPGRVAVPPVAPIATGSIASDAAAGASNVPDVGPRGIAPIEGRMAVGGPRQEAVQQLEAQAGAGASPPVKAAPHRVLAKPNPRPLPRRSSSWTGSFFER